MIDNPIVYRPRSFAVGWLFIVILAAVPVILFFATGSWVLAIVAALVVCAAVLAISLLMFGSSMRLTDAGVHLRTYDENVALPWADIDRFDCLDTVVIHTRDGAVHQVPWMATAAAQRMLGTLGYGDYMARELNSILVEQAGQTPPDGDIEAVRAKITADSKAGRDRLAVVAYGSYAAAALGLAALSRVWWAWLAAVAVGGFAWWRMHRLRRGAKG